MEVHNDRKEFAFHGRLHGTRRRSPAKSRKQINGGLGSKSWCPGGSAYLVVGNDEPLKRKVGSDVRFPSINVLNLITIHVNNTLLNV